MPSFFVGDPCPNCLSRKCTCNPELEPSFEDCVHSLLKVVNRVLKDIGPNHKLHAQLQEAAANVEAFEQNDDPRANGWVGCDGLP